jgi:photosystem II stability/assembly factor-like uncharacterized protein
MKRFFVAALTALFLAPTMTAPASASPAAQQLMSKLQWRSIGPYIGGRVVAVAGVPSNPDLFYMGGVEGGIWKSTNYGNSWENISDGQLPRTASPIGALAVADSNSNIIYAGTGESDIRGDFDTGDGIYKSTDAGKTWKYAGLRETRMTTALLVDPHDPNVVYASSMGHVFKPNEDRGVFKTTDGGKTWRKILYVDPNTGGESLAMDSRNSKIIYATMWQAQRVPWKLTSGGPGSGVYKSVDAGEHWTKISTNPGFPRGILGKIGISVAASNPRVVYAIVQARDGGVFRSDDAGATWKRVNSEAKLRQRAFYYMAIFADPTNPMVAYAPNVDSMWKTTDGGVTWRPIETIPHGDHHIIWINPRNPKILLEGNDGGATVSVDGGTSWSSIDNQPTGQFYKVALDDQFPFNVYGAQQDEGAYGGPSSSTAGAILFGSWRTVALGESTWVAPEPGDPDKTYGSGYYSSLARLATQTGDEKNVSPWAQYKAGASAAETKYRFGWTHPIFFSPADPGELLVGSQVVFSSTDHGNTWKVISPDLTRNDPSTEGPSGGPVDLDQTGAETFPDIASLAVSPHNANVIWAGSADGLVHVTKDHGATWTDVTPPAMPQWTQISSIEPSHAAEGTAYMTACRYMWDDFHPYIYKTTDYGAHWTAMTAGLPQDQYVHVVREDPREPRLLFAGTRDTAYVSLDGGAMWQPLTLNLPGVQVRDFAINAREGELVAATHGRAFWILDNLALLEQLARQDQQNSAGVQMFAPETAWLTHAYGASAFPVANAGTNHDYGVSLFINLPSNYDGKTPATLTFMDSKGAVVRSFALHLKDKKAKKLPFDIRSSLEAVKQQALDLAETTAMEPGMNEFTWDMRYPGATDVPSFHSDPTDDFPDVSDGPTIVPGDYTAVLRYGGTKVTQPVVVKLDPRFHTTTADLDARLALEMDIHNTMDALDKAIIAAMAAREKLPVGKRAALDAEINQLIQLDIHSSEADVLHETKLREQIGFLANELELGYERPTAAEYAAFEDYKAQAAAGMERLRALSQ